MAEREYRSSRTIQKSTFDFRTYGGIADLTQFLYPFFFLLFFFENRSHAWWRKKLKSLVCPKPRSYTDIVDIPMFVDKYIFWSWLNYCYYKLLLSNICKRCLHSSSSSSCLHSLPFITRKIISVIDIRKLLRQVDESGINCLLYVDLW